jgi:hypothetical protein
MGAQGAQQPKTAVSGPGRDGERRAFMRRECKISCDTCPTVTAQMLGQAGALAVDSCGVCGGDDRACAYTTYQLRGNYTFLGAASEMQIYDSLRSYYRNFWDGRDRPRADIGIVFPYVQHHKVSLEPFNAL